MNFLEKVVAKTRENLQKEYYDQRPEQATKVRKRSLTAQLKKEFSLIAEMKPKSPVRKGMLYSGSAADLAKTYADAGARAISVLCEPSFFNGKLDNLQKAKSCGLSLLAKDFVISERQLKAYAAYGADAVLLIQEIFDANLAEQSRDALIEKADELDLEVLLESHSKEAYQRATKSQADVLGINNRNLETLTVDVTNAASVFKSQPSSTPVVAESGISTKQDVASAKDVGFRGVLVGTALLLSKNPLEKVRSLL